MLSMSSLPKTCFSSKCLHVSKKKNSILSLPVEVTLNSFCDISQTQANLQFISKFNNFSLLSAMISFHLASCSSSLTASRSLCLPLWSYPSSVMVLKRMTDYAIFVPSTPSVLLQWKAKIFTVDYASLPNLDPTVSDFFALTTVPLFICTAHFLLVSA